MPGFFKIMWPDSENFHHLRIPPDFKQHTVNGKAEWVTLRTTCGTWKIKLLKHGSDVYLAEGWPKFVEDHSLRNEEFLSFKYNGHMCFDVAIFGINSCSRNYQSLSMAHQESHSSFSSRFPYFEHSMKSYNLGHRSFLIIPNAFAEKHFDLSQSASKQITLKNSDGISWSVCVVVVCVKRRHPYYRYYRITRGWRAFSDGNSLKIGDKGIFELFDQDIMRVHVFRSK